jgi:hypothetical protein
MNAGVPSCSHDRRRPVTARTGLDEFSSRSKSRDEFFSRVIWCSQGEIAKAISAIAPYQQAQNTSEVGSQAIASVLHFLTKLLEDYDELENFTQAHLVIATQAEGLAALAALAGPKEVAQAAAILNRALGQVGRGIRESNLIWVFESVHWKHWRSVCRLWSLT